MPIALAALGDPLAHPPVPDGIPTSNAAASDVAGGGDSPVRLELYATEWGGGGRHQPTPSSSWHARENPYINITLAMSNSASSESSTPRTSGFVTVVS